MNGTEIAFVITAILGSTGVWGVSSLFKGSPKVKIKDIPPVQVDPETAVLKSQVEALTGLLISTVQRVETLENERDTALRNEAHSDALADDARRKERLAVGYVRELRSHIVQRKQPPPPDWPAGWVHE